MAQAEGFEPPCRLGKRFSRPPRCDHFDKPAYFLKFVFRILALASIFGKAEIFLSQCKIVLLFSIKFLLDIAFDAKSFKISGILQVSFAYNFNAHI